MAPLPEQHRIVAEIETQLTRLDAAVAALERARANLKRYRAAVLKAACEGRLVPTEAELARAGGREFESAAVLVDQILADRVRSVGAHRCAPSDTSGVPDGWAETTLGALTTLITSGSRGWASFYSDQGVRFLRAQDIKSDKLNMDSVVFVKLPEGAEGLRTRVQTHDLLVTITGANVTKTAMVDQEVSESYVSQHVGLVRPTLSATAPYLYYWIISPTHGRQTLEKEAYGAGKPGLNLDDLRQLSVMLPPLAEQHRIVAEVERRLSVVDDMEKTVGHGLTRAARLRQAILRKAFAGELVPQDPADEPASVLLERIRAELADSPSAPKKRQHRGQDQGRSRQTALGLLESR